MRDWRIARTRDPVPRRAPRSRPPDCRHRPCGYSGSPPATSTADRSGRDRRRSDDCRPARSKRRSCSWAAGCCPPSAWSRWAIDFGHRFGYCDTTKAAGGHLQGEFIEGLATRSLSSVCLIKIMLLIRHVVRWPAIIAKEYILNENYNCHLCGLSVTLASLKNIGKSAKGMWISFINSQKKCCAVGLANF